MLCNAGGGCQIFWKKALRGGGSGSNFQKKSRMSSSSSSDTSAGQRFPPHNRTLGVREFRVGGGVHDSYTFQCGLVGSFTSPGIDTR